MDQLSLIEIEEQIEETKREILCIGSIRPGTLVDFSVKGGKTRVGGPYNLVVHSKQGKKISRYVSPKYVDELKLQINNYKRLKKLFKKWSELGVEYSQLKMKLFEHERELTQEDNMVQQIDTINSKRRSELRRDAKYLHIMKYMGSKRELLPDILKATKKLLPNGGTVLDIFAGTGSVGAYLKSDFTIYSNDIQKYSTVIADALICSDSVEPFHNIEELAVNLKKHYKRNLTELERLLKNTINDSDLFISIDKGDWDEAKRKKYIKFFDSFPSPTNDFFTKNKELSELVERYFHNSAEKLYSSFPYFQTTFLFSETYFSVFQAAQIDSLKYAIDKVFNYNDTHKNIALSALIYAHSYCSSGTGHFAMFRDLKDVKSAEDTFIYRKRDVWSYFLTKFNELLQYCDFNKEFKHKTYTMDFQELLDSKEVMRNVDLVYADPPYSFVHYSRFYHATESLVLYDYDIPKYKGRYRSDRHQSPFCQKQNVASSFELLIEKCSKHKSNIIFSYSDTGMISLEEILVLINAHSYQIDIQEINYNHSTMGRSGHKANQIKEYLILCKYQVMH